MWALWGHGIFEVVVVSDRAREMRKLEQVMIKLSTVGPLLLFKRVNFSLRTKNTDHPSKFT